MTAARKLRWAQEDHDHGPTAVPVFTPTTNGVVPAPGSPTTGKVLLDSGWGPPPASGHSRTVSAQSTGLLAAGAGATLTFGMASAFTLLRVEASVACRVRGYVTSAHATADVLRPVGDMPSAPDHGLLWETVGVTDLWLPRPADGYTPDGSVNVPVRIDNTGGVPQVITVTLTYVQTED